METTITTPLSEPPTSIHIIISTSTRSSLTSSIWPLLLLQKRNGDLAQKHKYCGFNFATYAKSPKEAYPSAISTPWGWTRSYFPTWAQQKSKFCRTQTQIPLRFRKTHTYVHLTKLLHDYTKLTSTALRLAADWTSYGYYTILRNPNTSYPEFLFFLSRCY